MKTLYGVVLATLFLTACGGGGGSSVIPPDGSNAINFQGSLVSTLSGGTNCRVTADNLLWYTVPQGHFSPIDYLSGACDKPGTFGLDSGSIASWAKPTGVTQAMVAIASVVYGAPLAGITTMASLAHATNAPVTWLDGELSAVTAGADYNSYHTQYGDDVSTTYIALSAFESALSWVAPGVADEGVDHERMTSNDTAVGDFSFWGIAWNSHGVDGTYDEGAPWGSYCTDLNSYKRPNPQSGCPLVSVEWTARDLTRAYLSNREDIFSTDPDDVTIRGGMSTATATAYERAIVDAYAAAGQTQPLTMVLQQESTETEEYPADPPILTALYQEAQADGLKPVTLAQAAKAQQTNGNQTRVIAFPGIPVANYAAVPATIDFHDTNVGMTFVAGKAAPERVFEFAKETTSVYDLGVPQLTQMPTITAVAASAGSLHSISLHPPQRNMASLFGRILAFWAIPARTSTRPATPEQ